MAIQMEVRSELKRLFEKNAQIGLTREEKSRARELIASPILSKNDCWICEMSCATISKAIFNTGLCVEHAYRVLAAQK